MEVEAPASVSTVYMEYSIALPAVVERLTTSAPVGLRVQESNVDLMITTRASSNSPCPATPESPATPTSQQPAVSELPVPISRDESSIQLVCTERSPKSTFRKSIQLKCGNWKTGFEVGMLVGVIIVVWVLFSIPTILYALPPKIREV